MKGFTLEMLIRIYDDDVGEFVEVREDTDGLELIQISQNKQQLVMPIAQARMLCDAVERIAQHIEGRQKT